VRLIPKRLPKPWAKQRRKFGFSFENEQSRLAKRFWELGFQRPFEALILKGLDWWSKPNLRK
jgi:hypothetical protein